MICTNFLNKKIKGLYLKTEKEWNYNMAHPPIVIESTDAGERSYDIYSRLMKDRIVFVNYIDDDNANTIIAQLFFLDSEDSHKPVTLYINSPGGSITAGLAIYDVMQSIRPPLHTICVGMAASMGAVLLASGTSGKRATLQHSSHMIHQASAGLHGHTKDIKIEAAEVERLETMIVNILSVHTKRTVEQIKQDIDRNNYMGAEQALQYGLVDRIITKIGEKVAKTQTQLLEAET